MVLLLTLQGWPFPGSTQVWVLPSTSGAAPMTREERVGPYKQLAQEIARIKWPVDMPSCSEQEDDKIN